MPAFKDHTAHTISLSGTAKRIVSIVPSQTELLYDLGLTHEVAGITTFCIHPDHWYKGKTRVGGTKKLRLEKIREIGPDLILANKEENDRTQVELLQKEFNVWTSDIHDLPSALQMIQSVGELTGTTQHATGLIDKIKSAFNSLNNSNKEKIPAAYLIWNEPMMTAGGDTFINSMLDAAGFQNVFASQKRYPVITVDDIRNSGCRVLILSSEPFPFKEIHRKIFAAKFPGVEIILADGEMFSWYGSRMQLAPAYFSQLRNTTGLSF